MGYRAFKRNKLQNSAPPCTATFIIYKYVIILNSVQNMIVYPIKNNLTTK